MFLSETFETIEQCEAGIENRRKMVANNIGNIAVILLATREIEWLKKRMANIIKIEEVKNYTCTRGCKYVADCDLSCKNNPYVSLSHKTESNQVPV